MDPALSLCDAAPAPFWGWQPWTQFAAYGSEKTAPIAILPLCSFCNWGTDVPMDREERVLMTVLARAFSGPSVLPVLVLPPLRFVTGRRGTHAFTVDVDLAHQLLAELCASVRASRIRKIVLLNASPANEDVCEVAARDIRIAEHSQLFCIHIWALGIRVECEISDDTLVVAADRLSGLLQEIQARPALKEEIGPLPSFPP